MPNPSITPTTLGAIDYTITNSKGVIADLRLDLSALNLPVTFSVTYPNTASNVQVTLVKGAQNLDLLPGPIVNNTVAFGATRRINASTAPSGTNTVLSCDITPLSAAALNEVWSVRVSANNPTTYHFGQPNNDPGIPTVTRLMCDPVAEFTPPASPVKEKQSVTLTAGLGTGTGGTTSVVGAPLPAVNYKWTYSGTIAITAFPGCGPSQTFPFTTPGVYGNKTINISLQVWFDGACPATVGFLNSTSPVQPLTIQPRPQYLMLILDRSGSMLGSKWDNAKTAARILTHLFVALRDNVAADRVGIIVFEDTTCQWRNWQTSSPDPLIAPKLALSTTSSADGTICDVDFGPAGACTPIGDALWKGMQLLNGLSTTGSPKYTIILLTDGYENSGTVRVDPDTPGSGLARNFAVAMNDFPNVKNELSIYTVGLGATVQEDVLDNLPLPAGAGPAGIYRHVTDIGSSNLQQAIGHMVSFSQEAQNITPLVGPPVAPDDPDPRPPGQQRYFNVDPKVNRLAVAIEWTTNVNTIELAKRDFNTTTNIFAGGFTPVTVAVKDCPTHGFVWVDVAALFGGDENAVPATQWRVVHKIGAIPQAIANADLLMFVDLFVKADIVFDHTHYRTGDTMIITARVRAGDQPIAGARVSVELARPGVSLGTFLATNAQGYRPTQPRGSDPAAPKAAMLQALLNRKDMTALPILTPASIFTDGTHELFDDGTHSDGVANDGNYANVYANLDKEGTYTWRFFIEGTLADGSPFTRLMTISKWVGVDVDPLSTLLVVNTSALAPAGFQASRSASDRLISVASCSGHSGPAS